MIGVDPAQLERARLELRAMVKGYLFNQDYCVNLIDFGFPRRTNQATKERYWDTESVALRFHVTEKLDLDELKRRNLKLLPPSIGPFRTDVIEAEYNIPIPAGPPSGARAARRPRLCGGLAISAFRDFYGTLGTVVRDRETSELMLLSNWHVLYANRQTLPGHPIYQPALNGGRTQAAVVARVVRETLSGSAVDRPLLDAAVARLVDQSGEAWENYQLGIGAIAGVTRPRLGMEVLKSGVTTGRTKGVITGLEGFCVMNYDGGWKRLIERVVTVSRYPLDRGLGLVGLDGDSGSVWLEEASGQAVALHFAGLRDGTRAQGMDFAHVLDLMGVELATSA